MISQPLPLLPLVLDDVPRGLRQALAQEGVPFVERRNGTAEGCFILYDSHRGAGRPPGPGQKAIDVDLLRRRAVVDPMFAVLDFRSARTQWEFGGLTLTEYVSRVDKRAYRREMMQRLRAAVEEAGGIWLRVAPFPFPYRSAFNLRIEHDHYEAQEFATLLGALAGYEDAVTHFVGGSPFQGFHQPLKHLAGGDVGTHGYHFHTYRTEPENRQNIERGMEVLRAAGLVPRGFAAPGGRCNAGLLDALVASGIDYSSEFGMAYDELPFHPLTSDLLQIPVHPVCLGAFLQAAAAGIDEPTAGAAEANALAVATAIDYFRELVRVRYRAGEPVFLRGHCAGGFGTHPEVLREILAQLDSFSVMWRTTLAQFADWWRARAQVRLTVRRRNEDFLVQVQGRTDGFPLGIEYLRGRHVALMAADEPVFQFSPSALAYEHRSCRPIAPVVRIDGPHGIRAQVRRFLDLDDLENPGNEEVGGLKAWAQRTLRRLRAG